MQPTSPFRYKSDLQLCLETYEKCNLKTIIGVSLPWNTPKDLFIKKKEDGKILELQPLDNSEVRDEIYFDTGAIYVFSSEIIKNSRKIIDEKNTLAVKINQMSVFDIDYDFQLELAENYFAVNDWDFNK